MEDGQDNEIILGGNRVEAKEDYLKTITNVFHKINNAGDTKNLSDLQWSMNYYTDILISAILNREARRAMMNAKEAVYQAEILKYETRSNSKSLSGEEKMQARVTACSEIVGECRAYFDQYFGFETKLAALI